LIALGEHDPPLAFKAAIHFDRRFCFSLAAGARTAHAPTEKRTHANRQVSDRLKSCPCICKYTCIYKFMGLILVRRMTVLSGVGLWLLPWYPAYLVSLGVIYRAFPAISPCPPGNYPGSFASVIVDAYAISEECHWIWFAAGVLQLVFVLGVALLCIAGSSRLTRRLRIRLTSR